MRKLGLLTCQEEFGNIFEKIDFRINGPMFDSIVPHAIHGCCMYFVEMQPGPRPRSVGMKPFSR